MQITIRSIKDRRSFPVDAPPDALVEELKAKVEAVSGFPASEQRLIFSGKTLREGSRLRELGVQKGAQIHLVMRLKADIELRVRVMSGKVTELSAKPTATAKEVFQSVVELLDLDAPAALPADANLFGWVYHKVKQNPLEQQRPRVLCGPGGPLAPEGTLEQFGLRAGGVVNVLHVVLLPEPGLESLYAHLGGGNEADSARCYGLAGSLYARCGGIYGVATFVDSCMDAWMADPTLNANAAVATWHERAQRCGFKFLVTQLMGYMMGGPQVYTGRDLAASHKHLGITDEEWVAFMRVLCRTAESFGLAEDDAGDLVAVVASTRAACVLGDGEQRPQNPGHPAPRGRSLYARLGGVYPLALFADRLIDALLSNRAVKIPLDARRTAGSLKYLFTELLCATAGGPEAMTGASLVETRLLCSSKDFFQLLRCAEAASDHVGDGALRTELLRFVHSLGEHILDPTRTETDDPHGYANAIAKIARDTGHRIPMTYVIGGGAVFFAGRDLHWGKASAAEQKRCWDALKRLGFKQQRLLKVKSVDEAGAGAQLPAEVIAARQASEGSFVEAELRVFGDMRTLYGRSGGVFGIAKLADQLMDTWMSNRRLNANAKVAPWTNSGQRQGFKFLVVGYLTGGPQRYTGQPMDVAHKHLGITPAEWDVFMADAALTMDAMRIDPTTQRELASIFAAFRSDCVVEGGAKVPKDPGLCRKKPSGDSVYAHAGGVYPLAQFVDTLVELALSPDAALQIHCDDVRKPGATRHKPGLKYLLTELVCNRAGGPEQVTVTGFEAAKLGVKADQWEPFCELVACAAAGVWGEHTVSSGSVAALVRELQPELCLGMLAGEGGVANSRAPLRAAGYSHVETTAALLECDGDVARALRLLKSGWRHAPADVVRLDEANKCPFGFDRATAIVPEISRTPSQRTAPSPPTPPAGVSSGDKCPFGFGGGHSPAAFSKEANPTMLVETLRERFAARANRAAQGRAHVAGRSLGDDAQLELDALLVEPAELCCSITLQLLDDPVIASDGCVYERAAIRAVVMARKLSPMTLEPLEPTLVPVAMQRSTVLAWVCQRADELLKFAAKVTVLNGTAVEVERAQQLSDTALNRAQLYVSKLIAAPNITSALKKKTQALAQELQQLTLVTPHGRVTSSNVLAIACGAWAKIKLRVRVMTGDEVALDVYVSSTAAQVIELVKDHQAGGWLRKVALAYDNKPRTLSYNGRLLPPKSRLAEHQIFEYALLHLVLDPVDKSGARNARAKDAYANLAAARGFAEPTDVDEKRAVGEPGSLYARCGGIYGVATFVDSCMDAWMADPTLNANAAVATWHERAQRCGFKFLVTQLMGYMMGGPQVYTGRDLAASHKHLGITDEEWGSFIESLHEVCDELGLAQQETDDVRAVVASMRAACTLADGEIAPPNPGHPAPPGRSLYARLGGVYPLALFADRVVDALLSDESVQIVMSEQRTMASLKYLFTELCCALAGGPETVTAPTLKSTKLNLTVADFVKLLGCVESAADHFSDTQLTVELAQLLHESMDLIIKKPLNWSMAVTAPEESGVKDQQAMRDAVAKIAKDVNVPLLYVPYGRTGFLLAMEEGVECEAKAARKSRTAALGFEEADGGVAMLSAGQSAPAGPGDKDILFLIDRSGSMMAESRMTNAITNAKDIFDKYTNNDDHVGLITFNHSSHVVFKLKPRSEVNCEDIRCIAGGGTAFYDALIKAVSFWRKSSHSYLVALTDGSDEHSWCPIMFARWAIAWSRWKVLIIGLGVSPSVRALCESLADASNGGMYIHAEDAGAALDEAFAEVAAQFVMPTVKSADAAAAGGGARGA